MVISETPSSPKENPSSQVSDFSSSSNINYIQFLQKALFRIGMERIVPNTNSRRNSTGNIAFDPTGYREVISRYLQSPFPSTHDNCKQPFLLDQPLETKPATPAPEKPSPKTPSTSNKLYAPVPRPATKDVKISKTSLLKNQIKPAPIERRDQDFKSKIKSKPDPDDPFYIPPTRLNRRYSEVFIPTTGLGDVLNSPPVGGGLIRTSKTIHNKTEPKKYPKPPSSTKTAPKPPENNGKIPRKVQALKEKVSSTVDQGSRKSKPVGEVQEKKTDKTSVLSRNERKGSRNGQIDSSLKKDETLQREEQKNVITSLEVKKTENKEERLSENGHDGARISSSSKKDKTLQKDEQNNNGIAASEVEKTENKTQIPTSGQNESRIHEALQRDGKRNETSLEVKKTENKTQSPASGQNRSATSLPPKNGMTPLDVKKPEKPTRVKKSTAENGSCSPGTRQRRSFDSEFGFGSPRKHKFEQEEVADEYEDSPNSRINLRRLSSDSVLHIFHSRSPPTVALKPCQPETNKIHLGLNNVIEETASKLIQTRKSKVKALVGAFEMISTNDPKSKSKSKS